MKKILFVLVAILAFASCDNLETQQQLHKECVQLRREKESLQSQINTSYSILYAIRNQVNELIGQKSALKSGREIKYIVKFQIKQGTFTLDIFEHVKNEMNSIEIEIPVSKGFYDRLSIGQDITNSFKYGSLIFNGDFSTLHMRVIGKRTE